ncbi:MAG: alkaline phosphatase family protein, partial [Planctomycetota bacterium]
MAVPSSPINSLAKHSVLVILPRLHDCVDHTQLAQHVGSEAACLPMRCAPPGLLAPAVATLATGLPPRQHLVLDDVTFDAQLRANRPTSPAEARVPTVWEIVRHHGVRVDAAACEDLTTPTHPQLSQPDVDRLESLVEPWLGPAIKQSF